MTCQPAENGDALKCSVNIETESELAAVCLALVPQASLSTSEVHWLDRQPLGQVPFVSIAAEVVKRDILRGEDPLGSAFVGIRTAADRRTLGQTYTPQPLVDSMLRWVSHQANPQRIVDLGAGSGRFTLAAARTFPQARVLAVEIDPIAALMLRANLAASGLSERVDVIVDDYRNVELSKTAGVTAFVGNPPYVRHHEIDKRWKRWYSECFADLGIHASELAGLHLHFFLKTALLAKPGDIGALITSAEWLDVNYGSALRSLLISHLGGIGLHVLEPTVEAFPGAATTAAITCFRTGERKSPVRVRLVSKLPRLNSLSAGLDVPRLRFLEERAGWSVIVRGSAAASGGSIPLGEFFAVHRGQVTGANRIWIAGEHAAGLPNQVLVPAVTKAKDLIRAGESLSTADSLRRVVDLPIDLGSLSPPERRRVDAFLAWARNQGADQGYIAQHRKAWWSVGLKPPAPILCTYMARHPPQFTLNGCQARHINIAHGLYPRSTLEPELLVRLVRWLNRSVSTTSGRTYAGGLTKFEPKELERLLIPKLEDIPQ
jgi:hypothetical protein